MKRLRAILSDRYGFKRDSILTNDKATQKAVGTGVFGGMLAAATIGVFLIPMLYVVFQWVREKVKSMVGMGPKPDDMPKRDTAAAPVE